MNDLSRICSSCLFTLRYRCYSQASSRATVSKRDRAALCPHSSTCRQLDHTISLRCNLVELLQSATPKRYHPIHTARHLNLAPRSDQKSQTSKSRAKTKCLTPSTTPLRYTISLLKSLDHCLDVAEQTKSAPEQQQDLAGARLAEDMKPLSYQVHQATRIADRLLALLLGKPIEQFPVYADNLTNIADFHSRLTTVIGNLSAAEPEVINERGEEVSEIRMARTSSSSSADLLSGVANAFGAALPNITFHANMAYAILRKEGVPLGKEDYIASFADEYC